MTRSAQNAFVSLPADGLGELLARSHGEPGSQAELLQAIIHSTPDAVYTKDLEGRYLSINPAGARMLDRPAEEILGRTDLELMPSQEEARATFARERAVMLSGETVTYEVAEWGTGSLRVWLSTKGVLRDGQGRTLGLFGISRDITERKRIEQALKVNEERLRLCVEAAGLATWDWDLLTGTLTWSANSEAALGFPPPTHEGQLESFQGRVHPEDRGALARTVRRALEEPSEQPVEFRLAEPAHQPRWLRAQGHVLWREGRPVRALGVMMDVTRQKESEEELRRNTVFQNQLLGIVSHDIRSPLSAIEGWARMLGEQPSPEEIAEGAGRIITSAQRIERLTRRLLDMTEARLGRGIPVRFQRADLHQIAERIVDELRAAHPARAIELDTAGDGVGAWDPDRLEQVIANLAENALKYSPPNSPVRVSTRGDGRWVELKVQNSGRPIPPELLPHIFDPFRKGEQAPGTRQRSLGLGLFIVRELVESHGGTIDVISSEAEGTTFTAHLPQLDLEQVD